MVAPKLRFQEFDGDWESKKLKDLTDILKCGVASTPKYVTEGGYPFLSAQNISRNGEMNYSKVNNISDDFYKKISKTKLLKGDILYSRVGASYGVAAIFDREEEYGVYVSLTQIRVNDTLNNIFLKQFLNSPKARIQAEQGVFQGGGVQNLNVGVVEEFNLTLPSKQEQTKIASFLAAVDEKITQLTQKHQLLSQYKQGMMQKLFNQQIRFKADDGSEFDEWTENKFGECINVFDNLRKPISALERIAGNTPYYGANGIQSYIDGYTHDGEFVLIAEDGANDLINYPIQYVNGKIWVNNHAHVVSGHHEKIQNKFLKYRLKSLDFTKYLVGGGRAKLNAGAMKEISFSAPCLEEQTKIADFLSSIDQKIDVVSEQLEQAKLWKKGLLQQMFV